MQLGRKIEPALGNNKSLSSILDLEDNRTSDELEWHCNTAQYFHERLQLLFICTHIFFAGLNRLSVIQSPIPSQRTSDIWLQTATQLEGSRHSHKSSSLYFTLLAYLTLSLPFQSSSSMQYQLKLCSLVQSWVDTAPLWASNGQTQNGFGPLNDNHQTFEWVRCLISCKLQEEKFKPRPAVTSNLNDDLGAQKVPFCGPLFCPI